MFAAGDVSEDLGRVTEVIVIVRQVNLGPHHRHAQVIVDPAAIGESEKHCLTSYNKVVKTKASPQNVTDAPNGSFDTEFNYSNSQRIIT